MRNKIFISVLVAFAVCGAFGQIPTKPVEDCIEEHAEEARAIYALEEAGCVLDYTEYTARGDFWTAYGHLPAVMGGKFGA